jgi:hypothetical protein
VGVDLASDASAEAVGGHGRKTPQVKESFSGVATYAVARQDASLLKSRIVRTGLVIAGLCVLALLARSIGTATIVDMLRRVGWGFAIVALLYAAHTALRGVALWQAMEGALPVGRVVRIRFGAEGLEMLTLTGPFVAEPAKAWLLHRSGLDVARSFGAVAAEYLLYNLTGAWMAAASLLLLLSRETLPRALTGPAQGLVVGIAIFTAGSLFAAITGVGLIAPGLRAILGVLAPRHLPEVLERIVPIEAVLVSVLHDNPARLAAIVVVEALGHALLALEIWVVFAFLGVETAWTTLVIIEGAVKFITIVFFFVPGQLGVSEGLYAIVMGVLGLPAAAGVTTALVRRARALAIGGIGFALLVSRDIPPTRA